MVNCTSTDAVQACIGEALKVLKTSQKLSENFLKTCMNKPVKRWYEFGRFRLDPDERLLLHNGKPVPLTPKVFDTLTVLVRQSGHLVLKEDLMKTLWPDSFVAEDNLTQNISTLRKALGEKGHEQRYVVTVPGKGYRFAAEVMEQSAESDKSTELMVGSYRRSRVLIEEEGESARETPSLPAARPGVILAGWLKFAGLAAGLVASVLLVYSFYPRHTARVSEVDKIVVADFDNGTGDPVFDDTLNQALEVKLGESPFLNIISGDRIRDTLRLMARSSDEKLTSELARQICQRLNATAMVSGSITPLGPQYVIGLKAVDCQRGDILAQEQIQSLSRERVLGSLGEITAKLRSKLGESLSSMQRFNTPMNQATTPSLEALKAYSTAWKASETSGELAAIPFLKRAVELDPKFAMAHARMGIAYANVGEVNLSTENLHTAFELSDNVSEREQFYIRSRYYAVATGEFEKAIQVFQAWQQVYPQDTAIYSPLGATYSSLGNYTKALDAQRDALRLEPDDPIVLANLAATYMNLDRLDEAERVYQHVEALKLETDYLLAGRYQLAFLTGDTKEMLRLLELSSGKPGAEDLLLAEQAATEAYEGHLTKSRELTERAAETAEHNDSEETAASYQAILALYEAEAGNSGKAREYAARALKIGMNRDVETIAGLGLVRAGNVAQAEKLAADLNRNYPMHTIQQSYWLPSIHAAVELERNHPNNAVEILAKTAPYELGQPVPLNQLNVSLYPIYLRGEAYLMFHNGASAVGEFQKIVDHRGLVANSPFAALARLGLARAYVVDGEKDKARSSYQEFFELWKDADPDITILKEAKAEYAKLQ